MITYSETISHSVKIQFWEAYLSRGDRPNIPEEVRATVEGLLLLLEANPTADVMERAIASTVKYEPLRSNTNDHEFIDLAFQLNLNMHNIMKKCQVFDTFQYALSKGFIPEHYNYLGSYLRHNRNGLNLKMIELLFSITPKDILFNPSTHTRIDRLINFFRGNRYINSPVRKFLVYTGHLAGGNMKFSLADFTTYTSPKIKETFKSFFGGTVVIGLLPREMEEMIMKQYFGFYV